MCLRNSRMIQKPCRFEVQLELVTFIAEVIHGKGLWRRINQSVDGPFVACVFTLDKSWTCPHSADLCTWPIVVQILN